MILILFIVQAGKSSFLNSLMQKAILPVYSISTSSRRSTTTTALPQEITIETEGKSIHLIDTPGLTFCDNERNLRARDMLLRCRGRIDRLKDPSSAGKFDVINMSDDIYSTLR